MLFKEYLESQFCEELIQFWCAATQFKHQYTLNLCDIDNASPSTKQRKQNSIHSSMYTDAFAIYNQYVKLGCERQVNISGKLLRALALFFHDDESLTTSSSSASSRLSTRTIHGSPCRSPVIQALTLSACMFDDVVIEITTMLRNDLYRRFISSEYCKK